MTITDTRLDIPEHELIWGPIASGKTDLAKQRLDEEHKAGHVEIWIIDLHRSLGEWADKADRYARTFPEAEALLQAAIKLDLPDGKRVRSITIDDATDVFLDRRCRNAAGWAVEDGHRYRLKLRALIKFSGASGFNSLDEFGGCDLLHDRLTSANVTQTQRS